MLGKVSELYKSGNLLLNLLYINYYYYLPFRFGIGTILRDVIGDEKIKEEVLSDSENGDTYIKQEDVEIKSEGYGSQSTDEFSLDVKSPTAEDFFDINELAEDEISLRGVRVVYKLESFIGV